MASVYTILKFHDPGIQYEPLSKILIRGNVRYEYVCDSKYPKSDSRFRMEY
jgi:hypothetical protein